MPARRAWLALAVFLLALALRGWGLGSSGLQNDEQIWHERSVRFVASLLGPLGPAQIAPVETFWPVRHIDLTGAVFGLGGIDRWPLNARMPAVHPGIPAGTLIGAAIIFLGEGASSASLDLLPVEIAARLPSVLLGALLPVAVLLLGAPLAGLLPALTAALLLTVEPALVGWSRLARLDMSQVLFSTAAVLFYGNALLTRSPRLAACAGGCLALGLTTTPYALFALPALLAARFLYTPIPVRTQLRGLGTRLAGWPDRIDAWFVGAVAVGFLLLYVNLWQNPILGVWTAIDNVLSTPHASGEAEETRMATSRLFYLLRAPLHMSPATVGLGLVGLAAAAGLVGRLPPEQRRAGLLAAVWLLALLALLSLPPGRKALRNGLLLLPPLSLLAGIAAARLVGWLTPAVAAGRRLPWQSSAVLLPAALVGIAGTLAWLPYPQVFTWPGVGDTQGSAIQELIGEGEGVREAIDYIHAQGGSSARVAMWTGVNNAMYYHPRTLLGAPPPEGLGGYDWLVVQPKLVFASAPDGPHGRWMAAHRPAHIVRHRGIELARVYRLGGDATALSGRQ